MFETGPITCAHSEHLVNKKSEITYLQVRLIVLILLRVDFDQIENNKTTRATHSCVVSSTAPRDQVESVR